VGIDIDGPRRLLFLFELGCLLFDVLIGRLLLRRALEGGNALLELLMEVAPYGVIEGVVELDQFLLKLQNKIRPVSARPRRS
jgi:hypothetical protein